MTNFDALFDTFTKSCGRFRKIGDFNFQSIYVLNKYRYVKFVRSTEKGFNFLDLETKKYVCPKRHLYSRDYINKGIPNKSLNVIGNVEIPFWMRISEVRDHVKLFNALYLIEKNHLDSQKYPI